MHRILEAGAAVGRGRGGSRIARAIAPERGNGGIHRKSGRKFQSTLSSRIDKKNIVPLVFDQWSGRNAIFDELWGKE
jgi:hypothetical protein